LHHAPFPETAEHGEHPLSIRWEARHGPIRFLLCRGDAGHVDAAQETGHISTCRTRYVAPDTRYATFKAPVAPSPRGRGTWFPMRTSP